MVFVKMKNDCGMVVKWILGNKKKDGAKNAARNKTERKRLGIYKRSKTQNMPTSEELWAIRQAG